MTFLSWFYAKPAPPPHVCPECGSSELYIRAGRYEFFTDAHGLPDKREVGWELLCAEPGCLGRVTFNHKGWRRYTEPKPKAPEAGERTSKPRDPYSGAAFSARG